MVCNRCIKVVDEELSKLGLIILDINLGEVTVEKVEGGFPYKKIEEVLSGNGFELIDDTSSKIIEKIKVLIIDKIHYAVNESEKINFSKYLSREIGKSYSNLSSLFSTKEGITIEKFIIYQKIERVKEQLAYNELTLSEIAYSLGYSSVQHLSNQFKQVTGMNPSQFKKLKSPIRKPLDQVS
ncbi:MAG: AraC family transcriptional regulator [Ignavibacteria bacterium]|nr:AraC family transcriptional regulator [Ignavibacteria bacterium]MBT8382509.1 AraC family transcriptional regulator [Ignavibacteria bacterium]MBT8392516.1 AraC family transcriptional regulator [Ignavibacteria bacterium]NNJ52075.1 helix-turn-helix transcriptional regulator [Ignavibacteriaceae bacterium]NNL19876.1 helix-turn-helix transcriptional regulator [Ignavibacteriaceae bacterium]